MKIKLGERRVRSVAAKIPTPEGIGEIRVEYYSPTILELKKSQERIAKAAENPESTLWLSDTLVEYLHALPDIVDDKDKPIKITVANLEKLDASILQAIQKAIADDMVPKTLPSS